MALLTKTNAHMFLTDDDSDIRSKLLRRITSRPLIDAKKIVRDLRRAPPELSIPITDNCNLRCHYCHASVGEAHKTESMTKAMIDSVFDRYFDAIDDHVDSVRISFAGGGEPTYRFAMLVYAITKAQEIASKRNIKCTFRMATNGCYGRKVREFIVKNFSEISLSFDGPAHVQNLHRLYIGGTPSYDYVIDTAQYFYDVNFPFAIRATVSEYGLSYLTEIVDFFETNFPGVNLALEPLGLAGRALTDLTLRPPSQKAFGNELLKVFEYAKGKRINIANSASAEYNLVRPVFCTAMGIPNWTVQMNGDIGCCSMNGAPEEFVFGHLDYGTGDVVIDKTKLETIKKMNVLHYDECVDCFAKYHCAGDCPDRRITNKSDCGSIRKIGEYILNEKINATSGSKLAVGGDHSNSC